MRILALTAQSSNHAPSYSDSSCKSYQGQVDVSWATPLYGGKNNWWVSQLHKSGSVMSTTSQYTHGLLTSFEATTINMATLSSWPTATRAAVACATFTTRRAARVVLPSSFRATDHALVVLSSWSRLPATTGKGFASCNIDEWIWINAELLMD